jgi:hypothetical protein
MKPLRVVGTIMLMCSSLLVADETEIKDNVPVSSETLHLSELLLHLQNTTQQLVDADDGIRQEAYYELKEGLMIVYALNCMHPEEGDTIQDALDKCYQIISIAAYNSSSADNLLLNSLSLFTSSQDYEQRMLDVESLHDWTDDALTSNPMRSAIEATDADIVYIQNDDSLSVERIQAKIARHAHPRMLYRPHYLQNSSPKILIIKNEKYSQCSTEYKTEAGVTLKLGGPDHGKVSAYVKGKVQDDSGNYFKGKIVKEEGDNVYLLDAQAGTEKKQTDVKPVKEKKQTAEKPVKEEKHTDVKPVKEKKQTVEKPVKEKKQTAVKPVKEKKQTVEKPVKEKKQTAVKPVKGEKQIGAKTDTEKKHK